MREGKKGGWLAERLGLSNLDDRGHSGAGQTRPRIGGEVIPVTGKPSESSYFWFRSLI